MDTMHPNDAQVKRGRGTSWFYRRAGLEKKHSDLQQPEKKISRLLGPVGSWLAPVRMGLVPAAGAHQG